MLAKLTAPQQPISTRGVLVFLISQPGMGKSSMLSQFPNCRFIVDYRDQGILDLIDYGAVPLPRKNVVVCGDFASYHKALAESVDGNWQTIVCESLVGIQAICEDLCLLKDYDSKLNTFNNFSNGTRAAANTYFQALLDLMLKGQNLGKNMFLTGHSKVGTGKNISGEDWVSATTQCAPAFAARLEATFANIFHIGATVSTMSTGARIKATGYDVNMYTTWNPFFPAKNRMGLSVNIPYPNNLKEAYKALCQGLKLSPLTGTRI